MKKVKGMFAVVLVAFCFSVVVSPSGADNTIASSTMIFQGTLTDLGGGIYTGVVEMVDENALGIGDSESGFDIYGRNGATAWFGNDPGSGPVWTSVLIGGHDAWATWDPDTPDWYQYSLNLYLSGSTYKWAVRNHPGSTAGSPHSTVASGVPMSGTMDWGNMYAEETDVGAYLPGTGTPEIPGGAATRGGGSACWDMDWSWGSEAVPLQYPGFNVQITVVDPYYQIYRVILTPAPQPVPPQTTEQPPNYSSTMCPLAHYRLENARSLLQEAQELLEEAENTETDVSDIEEIISEAEGILDSARQYCSGYNCIPANYLAILATQMLMDAIEELNEILGYS
jgi:hypothetical protein